MFDIRSNRMIALLLLLISLTRAAAAGSSGSEQQEVTVVSSLLDGHNHNGGDNGNDRILQTSGGNVPDLIAPTEMCNTLGGTQFLCTINQRVGSGQDYVDLESTVVCPLGQTTGFDFRQLVDECQCQTKLTPTAGSTMENKTPKYCSCWVCGAGFGASSISIDCNEPRMVDDGAGGIPDSYIFNTCTSIDCSGNCNGTCSIGCDYSGPQCSFCNPTVTDPPTPSPQVQVQPQPQPGQDPNLEPMIPDDPSSPSSPDEIPAIGDETTTTAAPTISPTAAKPTNPIDKIGEFFGGGSSAPPLTVTTTHAAAITTMAALIVTAVFM